MTDKWIKDTGLVVALVFLVSGYLKTSDGMLVVSGAFLFVGILFPQLLYPIAFAWLKFSELLNLIVPKIFFGIVFFLIIFPIGLFRRFLSKDAMCILGWQKVKTSFLERNHRFIKQDIETPY